MNSRRPPNPRPAGGERSAKRRRPPRQRVQRDETSAGGLVIERETMRAVIIGRRNTRGRLLWSLPKGHVEAGETPEMAAIREVKEETGLDAEIVQELGVIDFWFQQDKVSIHKTVHHFLLFTPPGGTLVAQEGEVDEIAWVAIDQVAQRLTHMDERKLVHKARTVLAGMK
jgi:ADP-ribose pyrophosphatase YjhB (NUDIX family)